MMEPAKRKYAESEAIEANSATSIVQILWGCYAFNASPQEAAQQVVADLYEHLSRGGSVQVHVTDSHGREHAVEVTARRE